LDGNSSLTSREYLGNVQVYTTCLGFVPSAEMVRWIGKMLGIVSKELVNNFHALSAIKEIVGANHPTSNPRGYGVTRLWLLARDAHPSRPHARWQSGAFVLPGNRNDLLGVYNAATPAATTTASATESPLFIAGLTRGVLQQQGFRERLPDAYNDNFQVFYKLVAH
jgi:hypothetical protein